MATITATVTAGTTPPSVTLVCSGGVGPVERLQDGVATPLRGTEDLAWVGTILDYTCPQQVPVTYRFAGATSALVEMPDVGSWIQPAGHRELALQVEISSHDSWETAAAQDSTRIPGRENPIVVSWGPRGGDAGKFELQTRTHDDEVALRAVLASQAVVYLSTHYGHGLGGYMSIGDVSWGRQVSYSRDAARRVSLTYVAQDRPAVVVAPTGYRWVDEVGTWADLDTWAEP